MSDPSGGREHRTLEMKALILTLGLSLVAALLPPAWSEESTDVRLRGAGVGCGAQEEAGPLIVGSGTNYSPRRLSQTG